MEEKEIEESVTNALTHYESNGSSLSGLDLSNPNNLKLAETLLERVMKSDKGGFKTVNEGLAILMRAQDLRLPFTTAIEHIHVINGKTGVDVHIIKALLLRAGVTWKCLQDYTPLYEYTDGNSVYNEALLPDYTIKCRNKKEAEEKTTSTNGEIIGVYPVNYYKGVDGVVYKEYQLNANFVISLNAAHSKQILAEKKMPIMRIPALPIDYVTKYEFTRVIKVGSKEMIQTSISKFSYSEAQQADLFTKDTYVKYTRTLISHRAFSYGARDIASDIIFGCMETSELKIVAGKDLNDADVIDVTSMQ